MTREKELISLANRLRVASEKLDRLSGAFWALHLRKISPVKNDGSVMRRREYDAFRKREHKIDRVKQRKIEKSRKRTAKTYWRIYIEFIRLAKTRGE